MPNKLDNARWREGLGWERGGEGELAGLWGQFYLRRWPGWSLREGDWWKLHLPPEQRAEHAAVVY